MRSTPPELLEKLGRNLQTVGNGANPNMRVSLARAKNAVVDSSYWTVETIREGAGLGDVCLAPRRFNPYGSPNKLYGIHIQNGIVKTLIRNFPDKQKQGFIEQFTLGEGVSVSISFDGGWMRHRLNWRMITDEKPWIFWVDNSGTLWGQLWDDESSKVQIDTNISKVRSVRGWKNVEDPSVDQGLIVAYIKTDGSVWYKAYGYVSDGVYAWESPRQITAFAHVATNLNLFLTNDYRVGFLIERNNGDIHWYVSARTWSGMAVTPETVNFSPVSFSLVGTPILYHDTFADNDTVNFAPVWFEIQSPPLDFTGITITKAEKTAPNQFQVTFSHKLKSVTIDGFELVGYILQSVSVDGTGKILTFTTTTDLTMFRSFTLNYNSSVGTVRGDITVNYQPRLDNFTREVKGDPPSLTEYVSFQPQSFTITHQVVTYSSRYSGDETVKFEPVSFAVTATKVGNNPI